MADEIAEAVQIIRVAFDGIEVAMKVGSGGISTIQKTAEFLKGMVTYEKTMGKTSMRKLLMKGGDLQVLQFSEKDMKKVEKLAKKYGILYSKLPDINKDDGMAEIVIHSEAVPRANLIIQKLGAGRLTSIDDYINNGNKNEIDKLLKFLDGQKNDSGKIPTEETMKVDSLMDGLIEKVGLYAMEQKNISISNVKENFSIDDDRAKEIMGKLQTMGAVQVSENGEAYSVMMDRETFLNRINGYRELTDRIAAIQASYNPDLIDITISKTLIEEENDHAVKTRVPGTWGKRVRYLWIKKENAMEVHSGKTILTFLNREKDYKLYDKDNKVVETKKGEVLQNEHYDLVEANVRKHYEKEKNEEERIKRIIADKKAVQSVAAERKQR